MDSTMQDFPLTVTGILRHGTTWYSGRKVITKTPDGYREICFGELGTRVAQLAHGLRQLGVTSGQRVATFMANNQEHLEAYFAVPCMGAVLHTLNIRLTGEQIAFIANQAEDSVVLVDVSLVPVFGAVLPDLTTVQTVVVVGDGDLEPLTGSGKNIIRYDDLLNGQPIEYDWPDLDEKCAAAMCYTSGTTGNPKGVVYSHRSTYLHSMSVCAANSIGLVDVLPDRYLQAEPLVDMIELHRPTVAAAVPTIWNDVLQYLHANPERDISSLRTVCCGGSAVPLGMMKEYEKHFGVVIRQGWGMTETSPLAALATPPPEVAGEDAWMLRAAAGRVASGVEIRIVDDEGGVLPNDGKAVGEIEVRGPWITGSYYLNADAEKFHDGWLRTGDVGRVDPQGFITLTDRAKDVIKSGGEWISSVELELCLMEHPAVLEAAVVAVPDERWQERPLAAVVIKSDSLSTAQELRNHLCDKVARFWLPERWTFIDEIPKTSVGKFDKKHIRSQYADGVYDIVECRD
jgi:fatty-acyl-CoA synthase